MHNDAYKFGQWANKSDCFLSDSQCICAGFITLQQYQHPAACPELPTLDDAIYAIAGAKLRPVTAEHLQWEEELRGPLATQAPYRRLMLQAQDDLHTEHQCAAESARKLVCWRSSGIAAELEQQYIESQVEEVKRLVDTLPHLAVTPTGRLADLDRDWCEVLAPIVVEYAMVVFWDSNYFAIDLTASRLEQTAAVRKGLIDHGRCFEFLVGLGDHAQTLKRAAFLSFLRRLPHWVGRLGAGRLELSAASAVDLARLFGCDPEL